ncbi:hypothetical protein J5N97_009478 [Dioscorea zingiberensis]|uniref:Ubiquitin-like protease family profile domain-containing protein n=1 Tax=Dioscorea zingiberensis TaxID=325984 RepID=A0A9D5CXM2_9LILI|nr:hypothetical protein J5N97_009478 [Dioscorea zingiberensis]
MFTPADHAAHTEARDINELKSKVAALQRELDFLRSHVTISNADVRRDMGDLIYGAVDGVREELTSQGKEIDVLRQMLHDFMARADDGTKTGVVPHDSRREEDANNILQDHVKVTASPVVISSTDVSPIASPILEHGVTQDIGVLQVPQGARTRKDPVKGKMVEIFVPVNDRNFHWYLVVVDVPTRKTYIVDSLPLVDQTAHEDMTMKIVGVIEAMCKHVAAANTVGYDPSWPQSWQIEHLPVKRQPNLILDNNFLLGSIPKEIGKLKSLKVLDLSMNRLSGSILPEIGNLTSLKKMDLHSNGFSGTIPPEIGNLAYLPELRFDRIRFNGLIPGNDTNPEEITSVESILFDLSTLKTATANFSEENKLGEGGFGSVYKMVKNVSCPGSDA